jgi:hypothetical protein
MRKAQAALEEKRREDKDPWKKQTIALIIQGLKEFPRAAIRAGKEPSVHQRSGGLTKTILGWVLSPNRMIIDKRGKCWDGSNYYGILGNSEKRSLNECAEIIYRDKTFTEARSNGLSSEDAVKQYFLEALKIR